MNQLAHSQACPARAASSLPFVSVIVPVLNDLTRLKRCLGALERQTYPSDRYEVIVVDNGSDPGQNPEGMMMFEQATTAFEPYPSSFAARNRGIGLAKGEVIAFTDADCIPASDWLEKGVDRLLQTPNCGLVGGRVDVFLRQNHRATPIELYEQITAFPQQELVEKHRYAATANVFTRRSVIARVGSFAAELKSSGDIEWGQRVAANGYRLVYAEEASVAHPARYSFQQLVKRTIRLAGGAYDLHQYEARSKWQRQWVYLRTLMHHLVPPVNFAIAAFRDAKLSTLNQKILVSLVMICVRYISAYELIRLKFGGESTRD